MDIVAKKLIKHLRSIGICVSTSTKARGNQGFYIKNKIYISKYVPEHRIIPILLHEFAHYIHSKIEPFMERTGGTIEVLFDDDAPQFYLEELIKVTNFVDNNSKYEKLIFHKNIIKNKIIEYENVIKEDYPDFMRSKKFKEFDKYIKSSEAKYLLKYDRVKLIKRIPKNETKLYCIENIERDFPQLSKAFVAYIRLKSCQKRQARVSAKINRMKKYYSKPTELFARLVEGLYINSNQILSLAPNSYKRFMELLDAGYYKDLREVFYCFIFNKE